jgi:hypothetical protein
MAKDLSVRNVEIQKFIRIQTIPEASSMDSAAKAHTLITSSRTFHYVQGFVGVDACKQGDIGVKARVLLKDDGKPTSGQGVVC